MSIHAHCFRGSSLQFFAAPCIPPHTLTILYIASLFRSLCLRSLYLTVSLHLANSFTLSTACVVLRLTPSFPPPLFLSQSESERETACVSVYVFLLNMYTCFCIRVCVDTRPHTHVHALTHARAHARDHARAQHTNTRSHTYSRTNKHAHIHARASLAWNTHHLTNKHTDIQLPTTCVCVCVCACAYVQLFQ